MTPANLPTMHPAEPHFRAYEQALSQIVTRYPVASTVNSVGVAQSTLRQNLKQALNVFVHNPQIQSHIPRDLAAIVLREFVFSPNADGLSIYIGPRRGTRLKNSVQLSTEASGSSGSSPASIPPIDVSDTRTLDALLHLKNYDHLPFPITIISLPPSILISLSETHPNVEIIQNQDNTYTIL